MMPIMNNLNRKHNLKMKGFLNLNAHDTHWSKSSLHWGSQVTQQNLVSCFTEWVGWAELVCSSTTVNGSYHHASTFFRSKSLTVSDNILELWIIPSSFWENDKVHLWGEKNTWDESVFRVGSHWNGQNGIYLHLEDLLSK